MPRLIPVVLLALGASALPITAQDALPANLEALEIERSRTCMDVLTRLEYLDAELAPLALRVQRLLAIGGAITLEESGVLEALDTSDPLEAAVADWFRTDAELAQRYLTEQTPALQDERTANRRAIQEQVAQAIEALQAEGDSIMAPTGTLRQDATACSGAIFVRMPAVAACEGLTSRVCEAARDTGSAEPFRFVESAEYLWDRQELRPWTSPGPLQVSPEGQLGGGRTVGYTRIGNIVVSVSFSPLLRAREDLTAEELEAFDALDGALGIEVSHPDITFAPGLSIQAALPSSLGGESGYVLHFGPPEAPDVLWTAPADTGVPLAAALALAPEHVAKLTAGEPLTLSAVKEGGAGETEGIYTIELTSLNQAQPVAALLSYMGSQLSADLTRLIPPQNP